jgi:hypothetical protein
MTRSKAQQEYYQHKYEEGDGPGVWDGSAQQPHARSKPCAVCGYPKGDPVHKTSLM